MHTTGVPSPIKQKRRNKMENLKKTYKVDVVVDFEVTVFAESERDAGSIIDEQFSKYLRNYRGTNEFYIDRVSPLTLSDDAIVEIETEDA
jgi:hypothetical protein